MRQPFFFWKVLFILSLFLICVPQVSMATGMQPDSSLLLIQEKESGGSMNVTNTDNIPSLLYTQVINVDGEDDTIKLLPTQPVVRVEGGKTQQVRFILKTEKPLITEHLKRVIFEGIPPKIPGSNKIGITIRQNLPVLIHPEGLPERKDPWTLLTWHKEGNQLKVTNPGPYVVRLAQQFVTLPSKTQFDLGRTYLLPGQHITLSSASSLTADNEVRFVPVSRYGVQVSEFIASLY